MWDVEGVPVELRRLAYLHHHCHTMAYMAGLGGNGFLLFSYAVMAVLDETLAGIVIA
jgi:hypothetical protein